MTVREINRVCRDAKGRNVYMTSESGLKRRVTKARTKGDRIEIYSLYDGRWFTVVQSDSFEVA